jgi:hypothetical protein
LVADSYTGSVYADGGSYRLQSGRWYCFEYRMKLNTPGQANGVAELWIDDCGVNGLGCAGTSTRRISVTNIRFSSRKSTSDRIEMVWLENWANSQNQGGSLGTGPYWDQVKASTVGPIGFMAPNGPPSPPSNLTIR